ncbi:hypothetical protein VIGAN_UM119600, partial [Vigna angularis var. angularis]
QLTATINLLSLLEKKDTHKMREFYWMQVGMSGSIPRSATIQILHSFGLHIYPSQTPTSNIIEEAAGPAEMTHGPPHPEALELHYEGSCTIQQRGDSRSSSGEGARPSGPELVCTMLQRRAW